MKSSVRLKLKLGLFIICGLALLVLGLFYVGKQKNMFDSTFQLRALFKNVGGLKPGNNVRFGGINVGTVESIDLVTDSSVIVTMTIKSKVHKFIHSDAVANVGSEGLMGDRVIEITPGLGTGRAVREKEVLASNTPVETDQILAGLKTSADNAALITQQLAEVAYKINHGHGVLSRLLADSTMGDNLHSTMVNLKQGSKGLSEDVEAAKHNFLLRGFFRKKKKREEEEKKKKELESESGKVGK